MKNRSLKNILSVSTLTLCLAAFTACKTEGTISDTTDQSQGVDNPGTTTPTNPTDPGTTDPGTTEPEIPPVTGYQVEALSWETSSQPQRRQWSLYLQDIILNKWNTLLQGSDDMTTFCPRYYSLDNNQRANAWAALFSAVTKYESAYSPVSRMQETTMGTDPITGKPVYSEGLLQLSYQDIQWANWCEFDWSKDRNLSATDPKKTILDPYKNLYCGVGIMAKQITRTGLITVRSGAYWAALRSGGSYQKISQIASLVKQMPFCQ